MMTQLTFNMLIKFQNDHIFQHNGFISAAKKYLDTFSNKKWGYEKGIKETIFWNYLAACKKCPGLLHLIPLSFYFSVNWKDLLKIDKLNSENSTKMYLYKTNI